MDLKKRTIAVIGLGYVGLPLAVEFGKNRKVIGYDINEKRILELQEGFDHTLEVESDELRRSINLSFTSKSNELQHCEIYIITVPTPVDKSKSPNLEPLKKACGIVGKLLKPDDVVIFESTVYPGATEEICVPILKEQSGLIYINTSSVSDTHISGAGFYCGYSPERINPGDKTHRLTEIKKITSGSTPKVANAIDSLYQEIVIAGTYKAGSIKVAEAAKVIENTQRDLNIAFVNELSVIFNRMDLDTTEVLQAAATKWNFLPFQPGLVGGHCIGVDPYYLTYKAQELGYQPEVILAGRRLNDNMGKYAAQNVVRLMLKNGIDVAKSTVGLLGITFKENCPDVRNSKVIDIIKELECWGVKVKVMDPWASHLEVYQEYGLELSLITDSTPVDSLIVAVAHRQFKCLTAQNLRELCVNHKKVVIGDLKALYEKNALKEQGFEVFRF
jgi:UDP-N-acetyl-D-galactosamine dehydrogenase